MTSESNDCEPHDTWRQIEALIDQVADLSQSDVPEREFYETLLRQALTAGAADGGAVWDTDSGDVFRPIVQQAADGSLAAHTRDMGDSRQILFARIRANGRWDSALVQPVRGGSATQVVACPITLDGRVIRILEISQRPDASRAARRGYLDVLSTFCELAADFHRRVQFRELRQRDSGWEQMDHFCAAIHIELDLDATAYAVANEAKRLVDCDRVTVAVRHGGGFRVRAVSGLDTFDRRATAIGLLERLVDRVAALGEPLWYGSERASLPPEIDGTIQEYVDAAHWRTITVMPLPQPAVSKGKSSAPQVVGVLVFESLDSRAPEDDGRRRIRTICRHAATALHNAATYDRLPARGLLEYLGRLRSGRSWTKLACWATPILIVIAALVLVPADFYIRSDGRLRPERQQRVFAPRDGQVQRLEVQHGQLIDANSVVATMRSSELDFEITRLLGDLETTTKQLDAAQASRLGANPTDAAERDEYARLTAEEERLGKLLTSLQQQRDLLEAQRELLQIRSPIFGQVVTWDLEGRLQRRPVKRGQVLLTVADVRGPWILELQVPDRYVCYVQNARKTLRPDLDVTFMLATDLGKSYSGRLKHFATASEPNESQQLFATAWVTLQQDMLVDPRPGAGVTTRIHCGRRAIGYVWLHDLIAAVRSKLFL